jgi:UDP-N-acetylmuramate--alanine ligase
MPPHLHLIGAGGIGVSAIGRYYKNLGWTVSGSDSSESEITRDLVREGFDIHIGHRAENLPAYTDLLVHTEGIFIAAAGVSHGKASSVNVELALAQERGIKIRSYPQALADITNSKRQIAVAGSHGKSSTTSLLGVMLAGSNVGGSTIVGTKLAQFGGTNLHIDDRSDWFAIEACEYKRHFLEYTPYVTVITNIDIDHLDYYRDEADYQSAFVSLIGRTRWAVVLSRLDDGCRKLYESLAPGARDRLKWYWVEMDGFAEAGSGTPTAIPRLSLKVPGEHLRLDANLAYAVGEIVGIPEIERIAGLEGYGGSWRRSEIVGTTANGNIVMSDYGHHPSELRPTFGAIRAKYPDRELVVIFQPHQAARTRALLGDFATCFGDADQVIIPDIYLSRDTEEDIAYMTADRLVDAIRPHQKNVRNA